MRNASDGSTGNRIDAGMFVEDGLIVEEGEIYMSIIDFNDDGAWNEMVML